MNSMGRWDLKSGESVLALSGRILGRVGAVEHGAFQLVGEDAEFWLADSSIYAVERTGVVLMCEQEGIEQYVIKRRDEESRAS